MNTAEFIEKQSNTVVMMAGAALLVLTWSIDYASGPEFSSLILYLIPVIFVTWFVGRWAGIIMSVTSSAAWLLTDAMARYPYPHIIVPFWNLIETLGIFLVIVYILLKLAGQYTALEFERRQFLSILDTTENLIYISDPRTYEIMYVNKTLRRLLEPGMIGKKCHLLFHNSEEPCDICTNKYIFGENRGESHTWEYQNKTNQRWYRCTARAIKWPDGRWVRYETASDITESRNMEIERNNILSMFAHDMKNPVIVSEGFLSRLLSGKAGPLTEKQSDYIGLVWGQLNKLGRFIANFLDYSRLETEGYKSNPLPFNIEIVIKKYIKASEVEAEKKNIKIHLDAPDDIIPVVNADAIQVERVIANLLDNAIKYTPHNGRITIRVMKKEDNILTMIRDTGIGIPKSHIQNIYDPFYRVTRDSQGSGLGLSIVKKIVESNDGETWVESEHGEGSTFFVLLPIYQV